MSDQPTNITSEAISERELKEAEIIAAYAKIAAEKHSVSMNDLIDIGYTKDTIVYYFRNLARLNQSAREQYPDSFFDQDIGDLLTEDYADSLRNVVKTYKRFLITTAVTNCVVSETALSAVKNYCEKNNAHCLILMASDPAHNTFAPNAEYGTIDRRLINDFCTTVVSDIVLNSNLHLSTVKLSAKHIDPATSMGRIASRNGTFIFASPKQRLKAIPVSNSKYPHFVMTTGAITVPDYTTSNYMSNRMAFIAGHDHIMGGVIVEVVDDEFYHFRQVQFTEEYGMIDLGMAYKPDGATETIRPEAFVLGDWHSGSTDESAKAAWFDVCNKLNVKRLVLHDLFDGAAINHHERHNVVARAQAADRYTHDLQSEILGLVKDIDLLTDQVEEVIVVKSNHDEFLNRYLQSGYYVSDPQNHRYALDLAKVYIDGDDPLIWAVHEIGIKNPNKIRWLGRDEDYKIAGIQLGAHGDLGLNGARGGIRSMEAAYGISITGHSHTPEILRGAWQVGTSSLLKLGYNRGPSSWMHTSCLVYPNGCRQLINVVNGRWRLEDK